MALSPPDNHPHISFTRLIHVVQLWANKIVQAGNEDLEQDLLCLVSQQLTTELHTILDEQHHVLWAIQCRVLLSLHYLDQARLVEGSHWCAAATSLALTARLNLLGTSPRPQSSSLQFALEGSVPNCFNIHPAHFQEMVNAFWSVALLNNYWVAASGTHSFPHNVPVNTPYPDTQPGHSANGNTSAHALLVDGSLWLKRTITLVECQGQSDMDLWNFGHQLAHFAIFVETHINGAGTGVFHQDHHQGRDAETEMLVLTQGMVTAAMIRLHIFGSFHLAPQSHQKCFAAAQFLLYLIETTGIAAWPQGADPVLGPLLACVADAYATSSDPTALSLGQHAITCLKHLAPKSPLAGHCVTHAPGSQTTL
ncbi:hypothetical protein FB45DRAFT_1105831 [Roridomyces roridus]|uniref:Uncharacterized protein n=1 Tax=Roridomyces roridus TaxID=1738132 RepID=A0AAD7BC89_9AGAR|nr:hypothetical protein FB45DRAFT_1105831 [Roridomyces roridus]